MLEIRAIIPDAPLVDSEAFNVAVQETLDQVAQEIKADFEQTVSSWNEQPEFMITGSSNVREISTQSEIYSWVNYGTPPHEILPIKARALRFMIGGSAKTKPGTLSSGSGSEGNAEVFARRVRHPGIIARDFDSTIAESWNDGKFERQMRDAIDKIAS